MSALLFLLWLCLFGFLKSALGLFLFAAGAFIVGFSFGMQVKHDLDQH